MDTITRSGDGFGVDYLSWHDGIDALLKPSAGAAMPHVLVHVARLANTPVGICSAGMVFIDPATTGTPLFAGFVAEDEALGRYVGSRVFKGTVFEDAPVHKAAFEFDIRFPGPVACRIETAGHVIELELSDFGKAVYYDRPPTMPFRQNVVEARAGNAVFRFDGTTIAGELPPAGIGGGLPACYAPTGLYIVP